MIAWLGRVTKLDADAAEDVPFLADEYLVALLALHATWVLRGPIPVDTLSHLQFPMPGECA